MLMRLTNKKFRENYIKTVKLDFQLVKREVHGSAVLLIVYDTVCERFGAHNKFQRRRHGILLVYDVTNLQSFGNIMSWVQGIKDCNWDAVIIFLVGNKCDLEMERKVSTKEGRDLAQMFNICFFETSAKNSTNIEELFTQISSLIIHLNNTN
uniref:Uncharacterized protein n=1 Tax=Arcella intermedia TaxID=1963864 RepID=A0A6B2LM22_9EUKA